MIHFHPFPALDTPRLHLRQLMHKDAANILALRSDDNVNKYIDRPPATTIEEANAFIEKINSFIANNESLYWAVCLQEENKLIGTVCLWNFSADKSSAETGYEMMPAFQGKGLMNEAFGAVLNYAREKLHLKSIEAFTHKENEASKHLLAKNGFEYIERTDEENDHTIFMSLSL